MPTITATPFQTIPAVRVQISWQDSPQVQYATVYRINVATGEEQQLRPYVAYDGNGCILLSCGIATFWDTELPLDTLVRYRTEPCGTTGIPLNCPGPFISATFSVASGAGSWPVADTGQSWTIGTGTAADFSGTGTRGQVSVGAVGAVHRIYIGSSVADVDAKVDLVPQVLAAGGSLEQNLMVRRSEATDSDYRLTVTYKTTGFIDIAVVRNVAGVLTTLYTGTDYLTYTAASILTAKLRAWGNQLTFDVWNSVSPEPANHITVADASPYLTAGVLALRANRLAGNTNNPWLAQFDNFSATAPLCGPCPPLTVTTGSDLQLSSGGDFFLRDPLSPCNDIRVSLCYVPGPDCVPGQGVFFARLEVEEYSDNGTNLQPVDARRPVPVVRGRSDASSRLVLVTRTFTDRDELLRLLRDGTALLWQAPPQYGIPDRYMSVGNVPVSRVNVDHRYQPRVFELPFVTVDAPAGPAHGICGTRFDDQCDTYTTWQGMVNAGLSYQDLLNGYGSGSIPLPARRRWIDVETGFATWLAVETQPNTWQTLRDGA